MLKFYKKQADRIFYWESWDDDENVVVHHGLLGEVGQINTFPKNKETQIKIAQEQARRRSEGYSEWAEDSFSWLMIHYQIQDWGSDEDLDKRHQIERLMDECLGWVGLGYCDGGDIGSGEMNICCVVVDPSIAITPIVQELEKYDFLEGATLLARK